MGVLRSETMCPGVLVMPSQRAASFLSVLGEKTQLEFVDMKAGQISAPRPYKRYIQRLDEMERILRFLDIEVRKYDFEYYKNNVEAFLQFNTQLYKLDIVESMLKDTYNQFITFKSNDSLMIMEKNAAIEEKWVVQTCLETFAVGLNAGGGDQGPVALTDRLLQDSSDSSVVVPSALGAGSGIDGGMTFSNISGVIAEEEQQRFARFLFRMSRGNTFTSFVKIDEPITDPKSGKETKKSVFVVFFQDMKGHESLMRQRITKACQQFGVNQYDWPFSAQDARNRLYQLNQLVKDKCKAQEAYQQYIVGESARLLCQTLTQNSLIEDLRLFCAKEKSIYAILNQCEGDNTLRINVWYPQEEEDNIRKHLVENSKSTDGAAAYLVYDSIRAKSMKNAPTYFRSNEFIAPFQELVNTYGVPRYKEASPVPFASVTFPFIFGIMYGDVGHGTLVLLFALWLCWNGETMKYSMPDLYRVRYMLVMMGVFATYAGFLYNDMFSLGMNIFGSRWGTDSKETDPIQNYYPLYDVKNTGGVGPYPFGIDPAWAGASNELLFLNGLKMKMAVLFGVAQMTMGVVLRFSNAMYEGNKTDFFCECIPCIIFMVCFFGYMDYMILYKWVTPLDNPPSLINSLIAMAMGQVDKAPLWPGAIAFEGKLMKAAMLSVPWLLFPKIFVMYYNQPKAAAHHAGDAGGDVEMVGHGGTNEGGGGNILPTTVVKAKLAEAEEECHEHHDFSEEAIEQVIFTIEYVLGTVSHTASYLRMWALSLAHQQLSLVFFQKTLVGALISGNPIAIWVGFAVWLMVTFAVLLCMDSLECFLHTLRLHWVEFQSKFYRADGRIFSPYSFRSILCNEV